MRCSECALASWASLDVFWSRIAELFVRLNRRHRRTAATQSAVSRARLCAKACCRSFRGTRAALCAGTSGIAWSHGTYCARTGKVLSPRAPAATVCYQ